MAATSRGWRILSAVAVTTRCSSRELKSSLEQHLRQAKEEPTVTLLENWGDEVIWSDLVIWEDEVIWGDLVMWEDRMQMASGDREESVMGSQGTVACVVVVTWMWPAMYLAWKPRENYDTASVFVVWAQFP